MVIVNAEPSPPRPPFYIRRHDSNSAGWATLGTAALLSGTGAVSTSEEREKTLLDERMNSARLIRQALAKPLPAIEPLPPITARRTGPEPSKMAAREKTKLKLSAAARDAMAMSAESPSRSSASYAMVDRHAPQ